MNIWGTAIRLLLVLMLVTGVLYPLAITLAAAVFMPEQSSGSLLEREGVVVGSLLIAQTPFQVNSAGEIEHSAAIAGYFWARPSAVNAMLGSTEDALNASGGSNLGPTSALLQAQVRAREAAFRAANAVPASVAVPADMLFASASGLDPHISPQAAMLQVERVAHERGVPSADLVALVEAQIESPLLNFIGPRRVNVLALNLALDQLVSARRRS